MVVHHGRLHVLALVLVSEPSLIFVRGRSFSAFRRNCGCGTREIKDQTTNKGVEWFFNPPLAPHFGGIHEVMIKATKKALRAMLI